jgi:hypothetical protein
MRHSLRSGILLIALGICGLSSTAQEDFLATYPPCLAASQKLEVITLPKRFRVKYLMLSKDGIDTFAVYDTRLNAGEDQWSVLLIFQDETVRQQQLRAAVAGTVPPEPGASGIMWNDFETSLGHYNWKPVVNLKYVRMEFRWITAAEKEPRKPGYRPQPTLLRAEFYQPLSCVEQSGGKSPELGTYENIAGPTLPEDSLPYRAAQMLRKFVDGESHHQD